MLERGVAMSVVEKEVMEDCVPVVLVCWACGAKVHGIVDRLPCFSFEIVDIANDAGMYGVIDAVNQRSLVFCNQECAQRAKRKNGHFYKIMPKQKRRNL